MRDHNEIIFFRFFCQLYLNLNTRKTVNRVDKAAGKEVRTMSVNWAADEGGWIVGKYVYILKYVHTSSELITTPSIVQINYYLPISY